MPAVKSLKDLFVNELKDLYHAEKQMTRSLPKMAKQVSNDTLKEHFEEHLKETEIQITRLEKVFEELDMSPKTKKCIGMEGIISEGNELLEEIEDPTVLDAAILAAAQKAEHYEISSYGTLATYAELLGMDDVAEMLRETLEEEKATDEKLTQLAESEINIEAKTEAGEEEEEE